MAWTNWPLQPGDDIQNWDTIGQLWYAMRDRSRVLGTHKWPRHNAVWETGDSFSVSTNGDGTHTLTDSDKDWDLPVDPSGQISYGGKRWFGYVVVSTSIGELVYIPNLYDIVFDHEDPERVVKARIIDNTKTTLKFESVADYVTRGVISSVSSLSSRSYYIIKRNGLWWSDRWPAWANPNQLWKGSADSATTSTLTETTDKWSNTGTWAEPKPVVWTENQWAGKELLVRGSDAKLHRVTITSNTSDTISFATQSWTPVGDYSIIDAGRLFFENHGNHPLGYWYGGAKKRYWSHPPNDGDAPEHLRTVEFPASTVRWDQAELPDGCGEPQSHDALDTDLWSEMVNFCSEADHCYSPNLFKTIRQIQKTVLDICSNFVPPVNYSGATAIPVYVAARLFYDANVNRFSSTTTRTYDSGTGEYNLNLGTFSPPYSPIPAFYVVLGPDGDNLFHGMASITAGEPVLLDGNFDPDKAGLTVLWSYGFTRWAPLEFRHWPTYKKTIFIPDVETKTNDFGLPEIVVYDPPEVADYCCDDQEEPPEECCRDCFGVGSSANGSGWITHDGSSSYLMRSLYGTAIDSGIEFQTGDVARYVGDNFMDPALGGILEDDDGTMTPDAPYWDRFYEGRHTPTLQEFKISQMSGFATSGEPTSSEPDEPEPRTDNQRSLTDTTQDWFVDWYGDGFLRTESGTATGGSSTTLTDASKIPVDEGDGNEAACFWNLDRTLGGTGYKDCIIEIDHHEETGSEDVVTTYKTIINSVNPATGTITFRAVQDLTVTEGDTYRIYETAERNRWNNREVILTYPDGSKVTTKITHNDATTIWFADELEEPVIKNVGYEIREPEIGTVWKWDGTKWVKPTGDDPRGQPWRADSKFNLPHKRKDYGLVTIGDYISYDVLNELYRLINKLRWTKFSPAWTSRQDGVTPETNTWQPHQQLYDIGCVDIAGGSGSEEWEGLLACYMNVEMSENDGAAPSWYCSGTLFPTNSSIYGGATYAYGVTEVPNLLARAVDFYAMGYINASNPDPINDEFVYEGERIEPWNNIYRTTESHVFVTLQFDSTSTGLSFRTFTKYSTTPANTTLRVVSSRLGSNSPVPPVDKPRDYLWELQDADDCDPGILCGHEYSEWETKGFGSYAANNTAIARWDVPGGLTWVD